SRRRHTRSYGDWSSDVCSSDLPPRADRPADSASAAPFLWREIVLPIITNRPGRSEGGKLVSHRVNRTAFRAALSSGKGWGTPPRSEERRVGKEWRSRSARCH